MRLLSAILTASLLLLSSPGARAMNWQQFRQSDNVIDARLDASSSPYRVGTVRLQEAISHFLYVTHTMQQRQASCPAVQKLLPSFQHFRDEVQEQSPTQQLPSEQELSHDEGLMADAATADACDESVNVIRRMIAEKKAKVAAAASALQSRYRESFVRADRLARTVSILNFELTCPQGGQVLENPRGNVTHPQHMKHFVREAPQAYKNAYESIALALREKQRFLENAEAQLNRTFANGRCATAGTAEAAVSTGAAAPLPPRRPNDLGGGQPPSTAPLPPASPGGSLITKKDAVTRVPN